MKAAIRKSVPLTAEEQAQLERLRDSHTPEREALEAALGAPLAPEASEAEVLRALLSVGRMEVAERLVATGYAALAASEDDEDRAVRAAIRARAAARGW
jgi:hypothetical protein